MRKREHQSAKLERPTGRCREHVATFLQAATLTRQAWREPHGWGPSRSCSYRVCAERLPCQCFAAAFSAHLSAK